MPPTRTLTLTGRSDDLILVDDSAETRGVEELTAYEKAVDFHIVHGNQRMCVGLAVEELSECWHASIGQVDETAPLPKWPVRIDQDPRCDYSVRVVVEVPKGAELIQVGE